MAERDGHWRRTRWVALAGAAAFVSAVPMLTGGLPATASADPGIGTASAQAWKIDPKAGGLSIGLTFGQATANHQNQVAKAFSNATNMGVVGTTLAAEGCDGSAPTWSREQQPKALVVDSREEGAEAGTRQTDQGMFDKFGKAAATPYAEAVTTIGRMPMGPLGEMGGGVSRTSSGLVEGIREARASVDITHLNLFNVVHLGSLHWEVRHRSAPKTETSSLFTIGHAAINGQPLNTQNPSSVLDAANAALEPLGFKLTPGKTHVSDERVRIEPLAVSVVPNAQRDMVASTLFGQTQGGRKQLFDAILAQYCKAGTYISIFDIVVGSVTGAGELVISLGGAEATTAETPRNEFDLKLPPLGTDPGLFIPPVEGTVTSLAGETYTVPGPVTAAAVPARAGGATARAVPIDYGRPTPFKGTRGGALAAVGLVTLGVVAVVAEGDRRKMRAAQRRMAEAAE